MNYNSKGVRISQLRNLRSINFEFWKFQISLNTGREETELPSAIALGSLARLAFLLVLLILIEPSSLTFLDDASPHNLSTEPIQKLLFRLVIIDDDLNIVSRSKEKCIGISKRGADDGH